MMTCLLETIAELGNRERCRLCKTKIDCKRVTKWDNHFGLLVLFAYLK